MSVVFRVRRLAGLFTVVALLLSHGEAVAASSCAMTPSSGMELTTIDGQHHCPFSPLLGPGCTAAASLRSSVPELPEVPRATVDGLTSTAIRPSSRPSGDLFHPPRA